MLVMVMVMGPGGVRSCRRFCPQRTVAAAVDDDALMLAAVCIASLMINQNE